MNSLFTSDTSEPAVPVLTIDGPSGSGKGTISRKVAAHLGWHFLDSGALYRAVAVAVQDAGIDIEDADALADCARQTRIRFAEDAVGEPAVWVNGADVTARLRLETTGAAASQIAGMAKVREALVDVQHAFRKAPGLVADGRDMGTVIFPDALCKVFLTASAAARAERRHKQLMQQGVFVSIDALLGEILARDERDANRAVAPLRPAEDARVIDSTDASIEAVVAEVLQMLRDKGAVP